MQIDIFAWAPPIPRAMWDDKEWAYPALSEEWAVRLQEAGGRRIPGPINMKVMYFGYIDNDSIEEVILSTETALVTFVVVRITGPAVRP